MTRRLTLNAHSPSPHAVVLVLHGGREHSYAPAKAWHLAVLRMIPVAKSISTVSQGEIAVARLRFTTRGWNGDGADPLSDAVWALDALTKQFPGLPIGIVGHSMGGRVALRLSDHAGVRSVIGLAPWLPAGEEAVTPAAERVVIMHGDRDRTTSADASAQRVELLRTRGVRAGFALVRGDGHGMVRRPRVWHQLSSSLLSASLVPEHHASGPAATLLAGAAAIEV